MTKGIKILAFLAVAALVLPAAVALAAVPQVQTNSAANVQNNSAGLNGYLSNLGGYGSATVWFQWGTTTNYGNQTGSNSQSYTGQFNQTISGLSNNTTYHYRAVAQNQDGIVYGQNMTFTTGSGSGSGQITANAGSDIYVNSGQTAVLQGYGYDNSGNTVTYYWSCSGGSLSNYNIAQPTFTAPVTSGGSISHTCTLTVQNNFGSSNSDTVNIYVNSGGGSGNFYVQTNQAASLSGYQATLQGYISGGSYNTYAWFQWGTSSSYGNQTNQQPVNYSGTFTQNIANLQPNTTYYYRAVAQQNNGTIVYGQQMTFNSSSGSGGYYPPYGSGALSVTKRVINLTSGNLNWQPSVNAKAGDILSFAVTLQSNGQDIQNVTVRDLLPAGLTYNGNVTLNTGNYYGDITSGINIGTVYANQPVILSYQVRVNAGQYGYTTLTNTATVTSNQGSQTASASVLVTAQSVAGATYIPTGLTNDFWKDSFLVPVALLVLMAWLYFSGATSRIADAIKRRI